MTNTNTSAHSAIEEYQALLNTSALLITVDWVTFLQVDPPYAKTGFSEIEVQARYQRNGYDWDIHGRLYVPDKPTLPGYSFVLIHGGGVNELDFQVTPDGRPGLARVLAAQGFQVLTPSYPGLWPPDGKWKTPIKERKPFYILDRVLRDDEIRDRLHKATYQVYMQGIASLVENHLAHQKLFVMGHSTGGPMAACLYEYLVTAKVAGIVGWGSGGFDGWILRWREAMGLAAFPVGDARRETSLGGIIYRSVDEYRYSAGYEDLPELTPWGRMEERFELGKETTPSFNPDLQVASHPGNMQRLQEYQQVTGLPLEEYVAHLKEPDPQFLRNIKVLLVVGENDKNHWQRGGKRPEERQDGFVAKLYAEKTRGAHLLLLPKYSHMGHWALHNEKLVYLWLWAIRGGYFGEL